MIVVPRKRILKVPQCDGLNFVAVSETGKRFGGFTVMELVVVLGVVALMVALLVPAVQKARIRGNLTEDIGRIRQYGVALQLMFAEGGPVTTHDIIRRTNRIDTYTGGVRMSRKLLNSTIWTDVTREISASSGGQIDGETRSYTLNETLFPAMQPSEQVPAPEPWMRDPTMPALMQWVTDRPMLFTGVYNRSHNGAYVWGSLVHTNPVINGLAKPAVGTDILGETIVLFTKGQVRIVDFKEENQPLSGSGSDPNGWWVGP